MAVEMAAGSGGLDLTKVADMVRMIADQLSQLQAMLPVDAGEEMASEVDEGAAEGEMEASAEEEVASAEDGKAAAKSRAASLIARSMK